MDESEKRIEFGQLLTQAIRIIAAREDKPIGAVQDEIGYELEKREGELYEGGASIEHWRKGHVPPQLATVVKLAEILVQRGGLYEPVKLERFLAAGGHPSPKGIYDKLLPSSSVLVPTGKQQKAPIPREITIAEDGNLIADDETLYQPSPRFALELLESLEVPEGAVKLRSKFYIKREADTRLNREIVKFGTTIIIRAPRQTGKTSLLIRGLHHARGKKLNVVFCDLQRVDKDSIAALEAFLHYLAKYIFNELGLNVGEAEEFWFSSSLLPMDRLTKLIKDRLDKSDVPIILAMDEADRLIPTNFRSEFFGLVRSWHNLRAYEEETWDKLNIVLVISTEPNLLITDLNQSPFNVGLQLALEDFTETQVRDLNQRHGSPIKNDDDIFQLTKLLDGHPYLTRQALYTMVDEGLTWNELYRNAVSNQSPFYRHLEHHNRLLHYQSDLIGALKQFIFSKSCSDDIALSRLLEAGLLKWSGEEYRWRCGLYERYFRAILK